MKKLKNVSLVGNTGNFDNKVDYAGSEGLDGVKVVTSSLMWIPSSFPVLLSLSLSFANSSIRKWQRCNFVHSVRPSPSVPRNTQITSVSSLKALLLSAIRVPCMFVADFTGSLERPRVDAVVLLRSKRVLPLRRFGSEGHSEVLVCVQKRRPTRPSQDGMTPLRTVVLQRLEDMMATCNLGIAGGVAGKSSYTLSPSVW